MRTIKVIILSVVISLTLVSFTQLIKTAPAVPYPEGFRKWTHVKTGLIGPTSASFKFAGGFHHIYANEKALVGYTTGRFAKGSIIVFDVIDANEQNGNTAEGKRNHVDVMVKDSLLYADTGGWGFEEFFENDKGERTPVIKDLATQKCFNCHATKKDEGFVFSKVRN